MKGISGNIRSIYNTKYSITLFGLLKTYSSILMTKDFQKINIPKLPVFTMEEGIKRIKEFFGKLSDWKNIDDLLPSNFSSSKILKKSGRAGLFAGSSHWALIVIRGWVVYEISESSMLVGLVTFSAKQQRKEILDSNKYVSKVIKSPWLINDKFIKKNKIDILVHGNDNKNKVTKAKIVIFKRTPNISSNLIRKKSYFNFSRRKPKK